MTAIFSVDKMRVFFSVKVMYNVFKRMKLVLFMYLITISMSEVYSDCINQLSTFFLKKKNTTNSNNSCFCSLYMDTLREGNDIVSLVVYMDHHIGSDHLKKVIFFLQCYLKLSYFHTRMH